MVFEKRGAILEDVRGFFFDLPVFLCSRAVACVVKLRSESVHSDQGGTAKGIRTASLPSGNRCGSERSTRTPSTISTIPIQSVGTRCFLPPPAARQVLNPGRVRSPLFLALFQNTFVGLTNLGATCYVNTFLQVWFHNLELRRSLYECSNSRAQEHNTDSGISDTF